MRILFFDCFSGISGDMTLGALLDLGIDKDEFICELNKLNLKGYNIHINKTDKMGISGIDVDVEICHEYEELVKRLEVHQCGNDISILNRMNHCEENYHNYEHSHNHNHHHEHNQNELHNQQKLSNNGHDNDQHNSRNLLDIEAIIDMSDLNDSVKMISKKIFREIARAEGKVHNKHENDVHFHEVGAVDSIVDIVGTAICIDLLGVKKIVSSPLHDGSGFIECQHGLIPVPVPAVMEMLSGSNIPYICDDVPTEMVTPTGMGIIKCLSSSFGKMPEIIVEKVGYGFGKRDIGRLNALRIVLGNTIDGDNLREQVSILETNIDDESPEILGFTMDELLENGALDVYYPSIYMKKNRPAVKLTVITNKENEEKLVDIIFRETSTIGIRRCSSDRYTMEREVINLSTEYGNVKVKASKWKEMIKLMPEYEEAKKIAKSLNVPLWKVYRSVNRAYQNV